MDSFFERTIDGVPLRIGGLPGGVVEVMDFLDPLLTGGGGGVLLCELEWRFEGGTGGGVPPPLTKLVLTPAEDAGEDGEKV